MLAAAWDELTNTGYAAVTMEAVAARAGTSRAVLYRRWPSKEELVLAALQHYGDRHPVTVPDTGSLRDDAVALLQEAGRRRSEFAALVTVQLGGLYTETGTTPEDLRTRVLGRRLTAMDTLLRHAADRGEIDPDRVSPRIASLPLDLFRHEFLMTMRPPPDSVIVEIVDEIWLPLLATTQR